MDNASFHRTKQLNMLAEESGKQVIFLPPYSPELNPIEHFGNWLKKKVSDYVCTYKNLDNAVSIAFKNYWKRGVPVVICPDDPFMFSTI